jgi:hypothetical protein
MIYAIQMGSGAMIQITGFTKTESRVRDLIRGESQTLRQHGDRINLLLFQNKESSLKYSKIPYRTIWVTWDEWKKTEFCLDFKYNSRGRVHRG